jgi:hypothetical protein
MDYFENHIVVIRERSPKKPDDFETFDSKTHREIFLIVQKTPIYSTAGTEND